MRKYGVKGLALWTLVLFFLKNYYLRSEQRWGQFDQTLAGDRNIGRGEGWRPLESQGRSKAVSTSKATRVYDLYLELSILNSQASFQLLR